MLGVTVNNENLVGFILLLPSLGFLFFFLKKNTLKMEGGPLWGFGRSCLPLAGNQPRTAVMAPGQSPLDQGAASGALLIQLESKS